MRFVLSTSVKKRVVFAALVALAIWPAVQHGIVEAFELDPWLFFGLSMYTTTRPIVRVVAMETSSGEGSWTALRPDSVDPDLLGELRRAGRLLAVRRASCGSLYDPEPIIERLFGLLPEGVDQLAITFQRLTLGSDAVLEGRYVRTECRRRPASPRVECDEPPAGEL